MTAEEEIIAALPAFVQRRMAVLVLAGWTFQRYQYSDQRRHMEGLSYWTRGTPDKKYYSGPSLQTLINGGYAIHMGWRRDDGAAVR